MLVIARLSSSYSWNTNFFVSLLFSFLFAPLSPSASVKKSSMRSNSWPRARSMSLVLLSKNFSKSLLAITYFASSFGISDTLFTTRKSCSAFWLDSPRVFSTRPVLTFVDFLLGLFCISRPYIFPSYRRSKSSCQLSYSSSSPMAASLGLGCSRSH